MQQLSQNKKIIIVGILSFIIGASLVSAVYSATRYERQRDFRNDPRSMMYDWQNRQDGQTGMHRMPNGTMMRNMMGTTSAHMAGMMQGMVANLQGKTGKDLEKAFLVDMIPHHQGAVEMAKLLVADPTVSAELKTFAQGIITAQEKEIGQMNTWVKGY